MAQLQRDRGGEGARLQKSGFVSLGSAAPKRTKAGSKLAVPRPVNLPSLKKENAAIDGITTGWGSGGGGGDAAASDPHHPAEGGGMSSMSLVEKASWAAQNRSASQVQPAPWEQPRALNLREFPSLAAAAAASQQAQHAHRSGNSASAAAVTAAAAEPGVWDEDERGRTHAAPRRRPSAERGRSRDGGRYFEDGGHGYGRGQPPPHYTRPHGDYSPPRDYRRHDDEPPFGRHTGPPQGYHYSGGYGGWRDEPRDWQRNDRYGGPPMRYSRPAPPREYGRRYGRHPDGEHDYRHDYRERPYDHYDGYGPRGGEPRDPALFPPPPPGRSAEHDRDPESRGHSCAAPQRRSSPMSATRDPDTVPPQAQEQQPAPAPAPPPPRQPQREGMERLTSMGSRGSALLADAVQEPEAPPPPPERVSQHSDPASKPSPPPPAPDVATAPASLPERQPEQLRPEPAVAAEATAQPAKPQPAQQRKPAAAAAERKAASCERRGGAVQQGNGAPAVKRVTPPAPAPPPPPAVPKPPPPPPPPQPVRTSTVKPGVSWKALVSGVPDQPAAQAEGHGGDAADRPAGKEGKRGKGKRQDGKKEVANGSQAGQPAPPTAGSTKQRSKRGRGKKGQQAEEEAAAPPEGAAADPSPAAPAGPAASKSQPAARSKGRGRGKDAVSPSDEAAGPPPVSAQAELAADIACEQAGTAPAPVEVREAAPLDSASPASPAIPGEEPAVSVPAANGPAAVGMEPAPAPAPQAVPAAASAPPAPATLPAALSVAPIVPAAFGWSSPLADEVAKLQLGAGTAHGERLAAPPLAPHQLGAGHLALLPTLGGEVRQPASLLQPMAPAHSAAQLPAAAAAPPAAPAAFHGDSVVDVITSLPADLTLDLESTTAAHAPPTSATAAPPGVGQRFHAPSPPPPAASPPPFPGGLFPATSSSWQVQPPSKEAVQLFESATQAPTFNFGSIASHHMQFGAVAAAFGQQQQNFGPASSVDWSSPAPSPPPFVSTTLAPAAVFGPNAYSHHLHQTTGASTQPPGPHGLAGTAAFVPPFKPQPQSALAPQRPPQPLDDPAAALPDDVFDVPAVQQAPLHQAQVNGQGPRGRNYGNRNGRGRNARYPPPQPTPQHALVYAQHAGFPPGAAFPPHMPGWPSSQAPHFLPPQLVGPRQLQSSSGRGRGRGRNPSGGPRNGNGNGGSRHPKPAGPQQQ